MQPLHVQRAFCLKYNTVCDRQLGYILVFQSQHWEALEMLWFAVKALSHFARLLMYHDPPVTVRFSINMIQLPLYIVVPITKKKKSLVQNLKIVKLEKKNI